MAIEVERGHHYDRYVVTLYERSEAAAHEDAAVRAYVHWREADEEGQWVESDDGLVLQMLKYSVYPKTDRSRGVYRRFSVSRAFEAQNWRPGAGGGRWVTRGNPRLLIRPFLERGGFAEQRPGSWDEQEGKKGRARRGAKLLAVLWLMRTVDGKDLTLADWERVGEAYRPRQTNPRATARVFFKSEEGRRLFHRSLLEVLGVNEDDIRDEQVAMLKELFGAAKQKGKITEAMEVIDRIAAARRGQEHRAPLAAPSFPSAVKGQLPPPGTSGGGVFEGFATFVEEAEVVDETPAGENETEGGGDDA